LVALHGSWNRSEKDGYAVISLTWGPDGIVAEDFLTGFLSNDEVIGRPAELSEAADGSVYISDDYANAIYRVTPGGESSGGVATEATPTANYLDSRPDAALRAAAMTAGADAYAASDCGTCHSFDAAVSDGQVSLANLSVRFDAQTLDSYLLRPNPPMPPFLGSDEQRRQLAIYLLETSLEPSL